MRETCARVLAAALMTGAIAAVVAMSALFETPRKYSRPIAAPPSSLHRTVRLEAQPAPPHRQTVARLHAPHPVNRPTRPAIVTRSLVVVRTHRVAPPPRRLASTKPKSKPLTAPAPPAPPAAPHHPAPPAAEAAPPAKPDDQKHASAEDGGNGNGHGHDSGKSHKGDDGHEE
jgi:hypothetical protein